MFASEERNTIFPSHASSSRQFKVVKGLHRGCFSLGSINLLHKIQDLQLVFSLFSWPQARDKEYNRFFDVSGTQKSHQMEEVESSRHLLRKDW